MTVLFSPFGNSQYFDVNGDPAVGYTVTTYTAGSSTMLASYTDSTGLVANQNPTTLNATGLNPNGQFWLTSGLSYKFVIKDAQGATVQTVDGVSGVQTAASAVNQFQSPGLTPTYISTTSFSLPGDQTSIFHVGRRLQFTVTAGTVYGSIATSVYGALTTVTVVMDGTSTLDSGLSAVNYGFLSNDNTSIPAVGTVNLGTVQATTSGTSIDFLSIPSWVKQIAIAFSSVSTNGTSNLQIQIGDSGGIESAGYLGSVSQITSGASPTVAGLNSGFPVTGAMAATYVLNGIIRLTLMNPATNTWASSGVISNSEAAIVHLSSSSKSLSAPLDRVRLATTGGVNTFDNGSINIIYE